MTSLAPPNLSKDEITQKVIQAVAESLAIDTDGISPDSRLINDLDADSLDFMDIMFHFEDQFHIKLQKEDLDLLSRAGLDREQVLAEGSLSQGVIQQLQQWLPDLPEDCTLEAAQLVEYLTIESLVIIVSEEMKKQHAQT